MYEDTTTSLKSTIPLSLSKKVKRVDFESTQVYGIF
jgi:hypothetical protein